MSKPVFFSSTNIKMGLRLYFNMSKLVFFRWADIKMEYKCFFIYKKGPIKIGTPTFPYYP